VKTLSNDCSILRNDAVKVREELRQEKSDREMYESQFKQASQELGRKIMVQNTVRLFNFDDPSLYDITFCIPGIYNFIISLYCLIYIPMILDDSKTAEKIYME
jgi:hypothetical protein